MSRRAVESFRQRQDVAPILPAIVDRLHDRLHDVHAKATSATLLDRQVEFWDGCIPRVIRPGVVFDLNRQHVGMVECEADVDLVPLCVTGLLIAVRDDVDDDLVEHQPQSQDIIRR